MLLRFNFTLFNNQIAAHAKMYQEIVSLALRPKGVSKGLEADVQELAAPSDVLDGLSFDLFPEFFGRRCRDRAPPADVGLQDGLADKVGAQRPRDGFDFGEFGHSFSG